MPRPPDLLARRQLLDDVIEYLADHGLGDATLRPLAEALGTSPTRLMHHFGSKGELLAAALTRNEEHQQQIERRWVRRDPEMSQADVLRKWWKWMLASRSNLNKVRLGLEAATLDAGTTGLTRAVRAEQIGAWRANIERRLLHSGVPAAEAAIESSVLKSAFTGLTLDLVATGERTRLTAALEWTLDDFERRVEQLLSTKSS